MSGDMRVCDLDPDLKKMLMDFRFKKNNSGNTAIIMKVDRETHRIVLDEEVDDLESVETLVEDHLPSHQPRFLVLSYKVTHTSTNRVSFPLCFIFISPRDCNPELQMMYAGSKLSLQKELDITKVFELRELEEFTEEWLMSKLDK
jgi:hypothetical protein